MPFKLVVHLRVLKKVHGGDEAENREEKCWTCATCGLCCFIFFTSLFILREGRNVHLRADFIHALYQSFPKVFLSVCCTFSCDYTWLVTLAYIYWCCSSKGFTCFKNTIVLCTVFDFTCCVTSFFSYCAALKWSQLKVSQDFCLVTSPPNNSKRIKSIDL